MMPKISTRRGSALLIVLGMMSFMLFSGLAFAVYMRYSRLPTSFLRRTTTTRQLTKAALAEAIETIDRAIGDDPHPGVHNGAYQSGVTPNSFVQRVFFGTDLSGTPVKDIKPSSGIPTVLTLEGLAYLPPNLINDVRYFSRCTPTAKWKPFWFDSGRYAYVAVDVSDYFDVNRLRANTRRASSSAQRISLSHIFEPIQSGSDGYVHTGAAAGTKEWDTFIESAQAEPEGPFVSLADFNVSWNENFKGKFGNKTLENPFVQFVTSEKGQAYGNINAVSDEAEYYRQMTFVTDSWSPKPDSKIKVADLEEEQPYDVTELDKDKPAKGILTKILENNKQKTILKDKTYLGSWISDYTCIALWDYLDRDSQPLSLAVPTCERVPMICAIQPECTGSFKIKRTVDSETKTALSGSRFRVTRTVTYSLDFVGVGKDLNLALGWTYPFLDRGLPSDATFDAEARMAVFLTGEGTSLSARPGNEIEGLYWSGSEKAGAKSSVNEVAAVYAVSPSAWQGQGAAAIAKGDRPVKELAVQRAENAHESVTKKLATVTYTWEQDNSGNPANPNLNDPSQIQVDSSGAEFGFLKNDGSCDKDFGFLRNGTAKKAKVNVAVWARVIDESKNTVDMAPACLFDDKNLNGDYNNVGIILGDSEPYPLLHLEAGEIEFSLAKFEAQNGALGDFAVTGQALITGDPRFNHAPENWKIVGNVQGDLAKYWYDLENGYAKNKDGDIYMATSDQGYMQSLYELMMLPRIMPDEYSTTFDGKIRRGNETLKDHAFMWRTYQPSDFNVIGDGRIVAGDSGPKVNPYSDSTNVLMAAFANTPHDWRVASTNNHDIAKNIDVATFNQAYAWNDYSKTKGGKFCWEHMSEVACAFADEARYLGNWEQAWRELDWSMNKPEKILSSLEDLETDDGDDGKLYSVDKKFLYGFWHDSFSARQQLFLIFVRAEPMMMGGGVTGQTPPQLGARAVALVWRDPSPMQNVSSSGTAQAPVHRTRILFYHQFD